ncbi:sigma-70 family RNA polymerase sigma factor [Aliikangiella coralliicola]|uniref:Sigma-70 family RNA polymerase sigma factor n=1 Tax=Aliikangiella coralliicola TaxID=2592383 RepID=A0A545UH55_9GAMM|nr:sigma-70 family RNA polymerase sigma factor [Aliikangiella coralliicola]TQV88799.1 sigma-70 family RNA polymerase sigma factor [Aliikangiella coralliicola]
MLLSVNGYESDSCIAKSDKLKFTSAMQKSLSDEQLMLHYAKGDASAFEQLYARHKGGLYRYCLRQLNNQARAEECFQDIWMKLVNSRVNYQPKALFTTYLYRIAQNHIIDIIRKEKKLSQETELEEEFHSSLVGDNRTDIADELIEKRQFQQLRQQIEQLPMEQKTAVLLKMDAGLSLEDISNVLNCGRETVKSRLRYATARLKNLLGE